MYSKLYSIAKAYTIQSSTIRTDSRVHFYMLAIIKIHSEMIRFTIKKIHSEIIRFAIIKIHSEIIGFAIMKIHSEMISILTFS